MFSPVFDVQLKSGQEMVWVYSSQSTWRYLKWFNCMAHNNTQNNTYLERWFPIACFCKLQFRQVITRCCMIGICNCHHSAFNGTTAMTATRRPPFTTAFLYTWQICNSRLLDSLPLNLLSCSCTSPLVYEVSTQCSCSGSKWNCRALNNIKIAYYFHV